MFNSGNYKGMYSRFLGPLSQEITLLINDGVNFVELPSVTGWVSKYRENDLVSGGTIQLGDLRIILLSDDIPAAVTRMKRKDRIVIDNYFYSVIHWDDYTRKIGPDLVAVEIAVRGGGVYVAQEIFNIVSESGDQLITEDSAFNMVTQGGHL